MAPFTNTPEDWQRLDWQILRDGGIALYERSEYLAEDVQWLAVRQYDVYNFDCQRWASKTEMYSEIGRVLRFSEWWGRAWAHNFDALEDCLSDLPVRDDGGVVLVFRSFNTYASGSGAGLMQSGRTEAEVLLDVVARTCRFFLLTGRRFIALVHSQDPSIQFGQLGGVSPAWNCREWKKLRSRVAGAAS